MDEIKETKSEIRNEIIQKLSALPAEEQTAKTARIEERLFEFANFLESRIALLYVNNTSEVETKQIIKRCFGYNKIVVLPAYKSNNHTMHLMKIDSFKRSLKPGPRGILQPHETRCKEVPIDCIDIAILPGVALDEKGGRIGSGEGYYDRLIPNLATTTRKVALAYEDQIVPQIPMESHDRHVDIIITEDRVIYKI